VEQVKKKVEEEEDVEEWGSGSRNIGKRIWRGIRRWRMMWLKRRGGTKKEE